MATWPLLQAQLGQSPGPEAAPVSWACAALLPPTALWEKDDQQHDQEDEQATAQHQPQVDPATHVLPALLLGQGLGCLAEGRALWTSPDTGWELVVSLEPQGQIPPILLPSLPLSKT